MIKFNTNKNIFDMTPQEQKIDGWACHLNLKHLEKLIKKYKALQFKRALPDEKSFLIISPDPDKDEYKYRITYFDSKGPSGHTSSKNAIQAASRVNEELPHQQKYFIPERMI